ncbi:hypothetical protein [Dactylosporangium sp. CA-233914]|uniref:hypothetical protein n=1 Tax=Dactylosporangium sp. CA-233914 TaxID=3239934 RepID=UPI003D8D542E
MTRGALVRWLQGLEAHELGEVLRRRPDALSAPSPGDLAQLAARLTARTAVAEVVAALPLPALQVIEALARLGEPPIPRTRLAEALGRAPDDAELDATLRVLSQRALVWPDGDDLWASSYLLLDAKARTPDSGVPGPGSFGPDDSGPGDPGPNISDSGALSEPFEPVPPAPALVPADRAAIRATAAESAQALLDHAETILEAAADHPLARQRNGGVAAREHARLADALGVDEALAAHFADVVLQAGLLGPDGVHLQPTTAATAWIAASPPDRLARLLAGWWSGRPLRQVLVRVLHNLPPDTAVVGPGSLAPLIRWTAPLPSREAPDLPGTVGGLLAEATLLGVCAMVASDTFAISPVGRALADGRSVAEVAAHLLPEPPAPDPLHVRAVTSVVLSDDEDLLDTVVAALHLERLAPTVAASQESPAETVAALKAAGFTPERNGLRLTLRRAPSPRAASSPSSPRTASSPSVSPAPRATVSSPDRTAPRSGSPSPSRTARPTIDAAELARRLTVPMQRDATPLDQIRRRAPQLRPEQAQLLANAVEHGTPVWIRYVDANGRTSERVIENAELSGSVIEAWCRLRRDDRAFALEKIVAVARPRA